jgi:formylglycine-generating enzyme required for sulfatase activity
MSKPYLFASHSTKDADMVLKIVKTLEQQGVSCWIAPHNLQPGTEDWVMAIKSAIVGCSAMLLFATPNSEQSVWVTRETMIAQSIGRKILAFWCSGEHPVEVLPLHLATLQLMDVRQLVAEKQYDKLVEKHLDFLRSVLAEPMPVSEAQVKPSSASQQQIVPVKRQVEQPRVEVIKNDHVFVYVPEGPFYMGDGKSKVDLPAYYIGKYLISYRQFKEFADETKYETDAEKDGFGWFYQGVNLVPMQRLSWRKPFVGNQTVDRLDEYPVTLLTRRDMQKFCEWLQGKISLEAGMSVSIPNEAQWEKAARGGLSIPRRLVAFFATNPMFKKPPVSDLFRITPLNPNPLPERIYPWGDAAPTAQLACYGKSFFAATNKYDSPDALSPYGCVQMAGNVWEACSDRFSHALTIQNGKFITPQAGFTYVLRGGYFGSPADRLKVTFRAHEEDKPFLGIGFRLVINVE